MCGRCDAYLFALGDQSRRLLLALGLGDLRLLVALGLLDLGLLAALGLALVQRALRVLGAGGVGIA